MRLLQICTFYDSYLEGFYRDLPGSAGFTYREHINALREGGFGASHLFAPYMADLGYESELVIANAFPAQEAWARERGGAADPRNCREMVSSQIESFRPDVLYFSDPITYESRFIRSLSFRPALVVGWRAASIPDDIDWSAYDVILSNNTNCRTTALQRGAKAARAFAPGIPSDMPRRVADQPREYDLVFTGQLTPEHTRRIEVLTEVARMPLRWETDLSLAYFVNTEPSFPVGVTMFAKGQRWGVGMYRALRSGRICLNIHIDLSPGESGNMRVFESTGAGTFLLTEHADNVANLFTPGTQIETYRDIHELEEKARYYLEHDAEREAIARNGQQHCLGHYSMEVRARELDEIVRSSLSDSRVCGAAQQIDNNDSASLTEHESSGVRTRPGLLIRRDVRGPATNTGDEPAAEGLTAEQFFQKVLALVEAGNLEDAVRYYDRGRSRFRSATPEMQSFDYTMSRIRGRHSDTSSKAPV